jgi:hypothetical protein
MPPKPEDLRDATDVVEHLLREIYVIKDVDGDASKRELPTDSGL